MVSVGGAERDRTVDLLNAIQALSQLSYGPTTCNAANAGRQRKFRDKRMLPWQREEAEYRQAAHGRRRIFALAKTAEAEPSDVRHDRHRIAATSTRTSSRPFDLHAAASEAVEMTCGAPVLASPTWMAPKSCILRSEG